MDNAGWVPAQNLDTHPHMMDVSLPDLRVVVMESLSKDRPRFELQVRGSEEEAMH